MMRSLYSGVAGLKVHQTRMDVIGNNIANVNTVGFRSQTVNFSDLFYQTTQSASGPNAETSTGGQNAKQIGLGVSVSSISTNMTNEGGTQTTGNAFDLKINGSSFFIIQSGGSNYYSKAGNFTKDGYGNLVTSSGSYVMGYTAARNPDTGDYFLQTDQLRPVSVYGTEYLTTDPAQTTEVTITGNINSEDDKFGANAAGYVTTDMNVYDSLGNMYTVKLKVENDVNDPTSYKVTPMSVYRGNTALTGVSAVLSGDAVNADGSIDLKFNGTTGYLDMDEMDASNFTLNLVDDTDTELQAFSEDINVDFSKIKCFAGETDLVSTRGDGDKLGAGKAVGVMNELGIQSDGKIIANYDNGDTVIIGQILVASFSNPSGLEKQGDNLFSETLNSGEAMVKDITADGSTMSSGVLEMSNVDLADEFTNMIVTQRGYQANSRIITTSDTMIEELLSLKR